MAEKIRLAVKERRAEGASDIEIIEEVISALKGDSGEVDSGEGNLQKTSNVSEEEIEQKVTEVMHEIGIPAHILGHKYLRSCILMTLKEPSLVNHVTKKLYPGVAKIYGTTASRVERAIRHAIEVAWDRGDIDTLDKYFGYTIQMDRGKPTNSEFIAMISDHLRLKLKLS